MDSIVLKVLSQMLFSSELRRSSFVVVVVVFVVVVRCRRSSFVVRFRRRCRFRCRHRSTFGPQFVHLTCEPTCLLSGDGSCPSAAIQMRSLATAVFRLQVPLCSERTWTCVGGHSTTRRPRQHYRVRVQRLDRLRNESFWIGEICK